MREKGRCFGAPPFFIVSRLGAGGLHLLPQQERFRDVALGESGALDELEDFSFVQA